MRVLIGVDPDVKENGVAIKKGEQVELVNLSFFDLFDLLVGLKQENLFVIVEGGWLNESNWHKNEKGSAALNAKIGSHTGANHETGKKIVEMLVYLKIKHVVVKPTKTKVKAHFFKAITKITQRTNQEMRDAYMLIHGLN